MPRILLIRHGETDWNREKRWQSHMDTPLNEQGRHQAALLAGRLAAEPVTAIYSSDLRRAYDTALAIAEPHGLPVQADRRLREMNFGIWTGLTYAEIKAQYPDMLAGWHSDPDQPPPGGEAMSAYHARIGALLAEIRAAHAGQTVLVVAHSGPLFHIICHVLDLPPERRWNFRLSNTAISELRYHGELGVLHRLNDTCHLADLKKP